VVPTLVEWFITEWEPWYGSNGNGDAEADLAECCDRDALPLCLVATDSSGTLLGSVALRENSVGSELGYGPWLAGLLVGPAYRGRGVASELIAALEAEATRLGFKAIYSSTDTAGSLLRRRGWMPAGSATSLRGDVTVFRCDLPGYAPD